MPSGRDSCWHVRPADNKFPLRCNEKEFFTAVHATSLNLSTHSVSWPNRKYLNFISMSFGEYLRYGKRLFITQPRGHGTLSDFLLCIIAFAR